jgi:hypothetical protein
MSCSASVMQAHWLCKTLPSIPHPSLCCCSCVPLRGPLQVLKRNCSDPLVTFEILSNPEFLAEGTAIEGKAATALPALPASHDQLCDLQAHPCVIRLLVTNACHFCMAILLVMCAIACHQPAAPATCCPRQTCACLTVC